LRKREFTSFDVAAVVRELNAVILDSRVNNVYQLNAKTLLLKLHKPDKPVFRLTAEAGRRLNLTAYALEKPFTPPAFCMALRKYMRNARLASIEQYEFERVVILSFTRQYDAVKLVLEFFGDGNIVLIDGKGEILQALIYKRMRDRDIVRGEVLKFAPSAGKNPYRVGKEEFLQGLKAFGDVEVVRAVARFLSIGGAYAEEVLLRAAVDKTKVCSALSKDEAETVFESLQGLLMQVKSGKLDPFVVLDESGDFVDAIPIKLKRYELEGVKLQPHNSFNEVLDEFYLKVSAIEQAMAGVEIDQLEREAERLKRVIVDQEKATVEAEAEAKRARLIADTIYARVSDLQVLLDKFLTTKQSGKNWKAAVSEVLADKKAGNNPWALFESFDAKNMLVNVCVDSLAFGFNLRRTLFENAAGFYEQSKRARQRLDGARTALNDSRKKLEDVEMKMRDAEALEKGKPAEIVEQLEKRRVKHKEWFEKFRWFVSSDGFMVVAGRDAVSNEVLIKKYTEDSDVVFHADIVGAPFVVIKTKGQKPSEQCLREAAEFAAAFSRGWREGFGSVDVYWVKPEQLGKGGPSGESVGHGAFVVRGERNWMRRTPLRIAISAAIDEEKGTVRVGGGPVETVKARSNMSVIVVPGDLSGKELFKRILRILTGKMSKELREALMKLSVEEIRQFVPYGKGMILEDHVQNARSISD
jgi:predicted ribosome quality control (RQC) complex YloA/Tae2 family protein